MGRLDPRKEHSTTMKTVDHDTEIHYRWVRMPPVVESSPITVKLPTGSRIIGTHPTQDGNGMWLYFVIDPALNPKEA